MGTYPLPISTSRYKHLIDWAWIVKNKNRPGELWKHTQDSRKCGKTSTNIQKSDSGEYGKSGSVQQCESRPRKEQGKI